MKNNCAKVLGPSVGIWRRIKSHGSMPPAQFHWPIPIITNATLPNAIGRVLPKGALISSAYYCSHMPPFQHMLTSLKRNRAWQG
jgi:hypothetical protein